MKYIMTFAAVAALAGVIFVNRDALEAYRPAWLGASTTAADTKVATDGQSGNSGKHRGGGQGGARSSAVTVAVAKTGSLPIVRQTIGTIVPAASTSLTSPISGIVAQVQATDGIEVKAGDLLIQLDDRTIKANIQRDQALLEKDQAALEAANSTLKRVEGLSKQGVDTQQQLSDAGTAVKQATATISVDQSNLAADNVILSQTQIRAPFDGKLGVVLVSQGAYVAPGSNVVTLTQMKPVYAEFTLSEADLDLVRSNMASKTITATVSPTQTDNAQASTSGDIVFIDNAVDGASGTFKMRVRLANDDEKFWPGQSLKVTVNAGKMEGMVTVPLVALQPTGQGYTCYVVQPDKTVQKRQVTLALSNGDMAGVSQGLSDGELVVTEGQASLTNGSHVTISGSADGSDTKAEISQNGVSL